LLELITVLGKSPINLTALTTYEPTKPPRPHRDLFHPETFEPGNRLVVFTNASIEVVVFILALLSIPVLSQQIFGEEAVCLMAFLETLLDQLTAKIQEMTRTLEEVVEKRPVARRLRMHAGVGPLTALAFELVIGTPERYAQRI
jgi:hypothetical protein